MGEDKDKHMPPLEYKEAAEEDEHQNWEPVMEMEREQENRRVEEDSCSYQVRIEDNSDEKPMMMMMKMATLASNLL